MKSSKKSFAAGLMIGLVAMTASLGITSKAQADEKHPSVILVITDDQGYGDLAVHGNPLIKTPNLDKLHKQSIRLTNYHVDPTCSPTRSALMTGRYSPRTGVWHTIMGRSMMAGDEVTVAELFKEAGYKTGAFGKWHLGDNYPTRPRYQGFETTTVHGGGGVGQTPDFWGNDYFDDTYSENGDWKKQDGYCTTVFFDHAIKFIEKNKDNPFFCYIPTNVPHGPFNVAKEYSDMYANKKIDGKKVNANFYGMITHFDEQVGRLVKKMDDLGIADDTILIFTTDNGTAAGVFNNGMRGKKGSEYDGGHRVPCFIRWPNKWKGNKDINELTAHIDILPTLTELCNLTPAKGVHIDGKSIVPLLEGKDGWKERTLFVQSHRIELPQPWRKSAVMTQKYRLVNGEQLFDMEKDPGQQTDIAKDHPDLVSKLRKEYETYYESVSTRFKDHVLLVIGNEKENPTVITCHDWHANQVPWNHGHIRKAPYWNGYWMIQVDQDGTYEFTLSQQPLVANFPMKSSEAKIQIGDATATAKVPEGASSVKMKLDLKKGPAKLETWLTDSDGKARGAFFINVKKL